MSTQVQVSMTTFVDNVCRQAVERRILTSLPKFSSPTTLSSRSGVEILRIGPEPEEQKATREQLSPLADCMHESLKELSVSPQT